MREEDYIRIMDRIRDDHIENAMLWDASAQQNRRSIQRLSLGIGAIAACIAVVIGCIGYNVHREHLANSSGNTSGTENEDQLNLLGGHGEIKCTPGNSSNILYSDDEYYYFVKAVPKVYVAKGQKKVKKFAVENVTKDDVIKDFEEE